MWYFSFFVIRKISFCRFSVSIKPKRNLSRLQIFSIYSFYNNLWHSKYNLKVINFTQCQISYLNKKFLLTPLKVYYYITDAAVVFVADYTLCSVKTSSVFFVVISFAGDEYIHLRWSTHNTHWSKLRVNKNIRKEIIKFCTNMIWINYFTN
jgi:hypothetical protein